MEKKENSHMALHPDTYDGDHDDGHDHRIPAAVPIDRPHWRMPWPTRKSIKSKLALIPAFGWLLLVYFVVATFLTDPTRVYDINLRFDLWFLGVWNFGIWKISWVTLILGVSPTAVAIELMYIS